MCAALRVRYILSVRGAIFPPSSRKLSFVVFYIRHLRTTLSQLTVMRVSLSLVALVAGAQALSSSLYQKRGGVDTCANVKCSVDISNPLNGKTTPFGDIGENHPFFFLSDNSAERVFLPLSVDTCLCLSGIPSFVNSNSVLKTASSVMGSSTVSNFINSKVRVCHNSSHHRSSARSGSCRRDC